MKTREDFVSRARKALERPGEDVLLFVEDGEVEGLIAFDTQFFGWNTGRTAR